MNIAALLTVHNRKPKTLSTLKALYGQVGLPDDAHVSVYLVDDGSSDGTSGAVASLFPQVNLLQGTGNLYWCGGMRLAFSEAMKQGFDYYLWLNDDTSLFSEAFAKLLNTSTQLGEKTIVVGSTQDPDTSQLTYGGVRRLHRWRPLRFTTVVPGERAVSVETMNGNCVLIPHFVAQKVGNLDPAFTHGLGDFDYGLRARKLGIEVFIAPGYQGICKRNGISNTWKDPTLSVRERWEKVRKPSGLPFREWAIFARRYAGFFWLFYWIMPYLYLLLDFTHFFKKNYKQE